MSVSEYYEERLLDVRNTLAGRCNPSAVQHLMETIHDDLAVEDLCKEEHDKLVAILQDALLHSCCG